MPETVLELCCRWVPGTLDRVKLTLAGKHYETSLQAFERCCGRRASDALYPKGLATLRVSLSTWSALEPYLR